MAIKEINRENIRMLRLPLEAALQEVASAYGLFAHVGSASFTPANVIFKVELSVLNEAGQPIDKTVEHFKMFACNYGLSPHDLGKTFYCHGKPFTIRGLKVRSRKYPILARNIHNKVYKFTGTYVKACLEINKET